MRILTRREMLATAAGGAGLIALNALQAAETTKNPLAAKKPHFEAKAKRVIFLFMVGGPSQMDLFDPKPALSKWHGQPMPESTGRPKSQFTSGNETVMASTRTFKRHGQSGQWLSDLM